MRPVSWFFSAGELRGGARSIHLLLLRTSRSPEDRPTPAPGDVSRVTSLKSDVVPAVSRRSEPAAGEAVPFRVKGNVYTGTKAFFEQKVAGGLDALYEAIRDPALATFIQQKFLPVAWYDVLPAVPLVRAEARAMGLTVRRYLQLRSSYQAEKDLSGVYRFLLRVAGTENVALRLPRLFTQIFDFGSSDAILVEPGHVRGFVRDFPAVLYEWFSTSLDVYAATALRVTGVEAMVTSRRIEPTIPNAVPFASLQLDLRWGGS